LLLYNREKKVGSCKELLYAGSSTLSGLPLLTPQPILENILQLRDMLKQVEQSIMDIVKDVDQKKKVVLGMLHTIVSLYIVLFY